MSKFTLKFEEQSLNSINKSITLEFNTLSLNSVLNEITDFLKGCGYRFDGYLDIVSGKDVHTTEDSSSFDLNFYDDTNITSKNTVSHHPV